MYRYDSWIIKKAEGWRIDAFWTVVLEKTLESPLYCKEIQPVNPKGNQSCVFTGRTDAEAEAPILWPSDAKNWLIGKDPDAGKDWRWEEKGKTEDEMVGRHHWLDGHEFEWAPGVGDGQGSLACCGSWGHKESDTTEWLTWLMILALGFLSIPAVVFLILSTILSSSLFQEQEKDTKLRLLPTVKSHWGLCSPLV